MPITTISSKSNAHLWYAPMTFLSILKVLFFIEGKIPFKVPYREILTVTALCCRTSKMTYQQHCQGNNVPNPFHSQKAVPFFNGGLADFNLPNWKEAVWLTAMVKKKKKHNDRLIILTAISTRTSLQFTSLPYKSPVMLTMMLLFNIKYPLHACKRVTQLLISHVVKSKLC